MEGRAGSNEVAQAFEPPEEFDDYRILRRLGDGTGGAVFLAEDMVLTRHVALKFVASLDTAARQRFLIEARAAARIQHPNVVAVYKADELDGHPYLVSEFARGKTLAELKLPLPHDKALAIGIDLARGLAAVHRSGVLHCDIKAANAVITDEGAKLLDFGLATLLARPSGEAGDEPGGGEDAVAASDGVSGTPETLAPEIWRGDAPTRRSDVYALGALLYQLSAGQTPFADRPIREMLRAVQEEEAPPLGSRCPGIDPRLAEVVARCLLRDPAARYGSGDDVREALEEIARSPPGAPVPEGNPYRGLRSFDLDHRGLFFGRGAEIGAVVDRLRTESCLLVTGDSGVGKSSLCRAGVLPAVLDGALGPGRRYRARTLVPGRRPVAALSAALALELETSAFDLRAWIMEDPARLTREVKRRIGDGGLVLFLDQAEELVVLSERDEAERFASALAFLTAQVSTFRLLATVRADFLSRFASLPALGDELPRALYFLRPLSPARLREVIVGPARATGVRFEPESLVGTLVQTAAAAEGGLPLLQFALAELWRVRDVERAVIGPDALDGLGGVAGALSRHGDMVLARMLPEQRKEARRMLRRLVTLDNTRARRGDDELGSQAEHARAALDALIQARLVVAQESDAGPIYEIAHEVIVQGWDTLRHWLAEDAELRELRERLAAATAEWKRQGRAPSALWSAPLVAAAARLEPADRAGDEATFLRASEAAIRRGRRLRWAALLATPALVGLVYAAVELRHTEQRRAEVDRLLAEGRAELAQADARAVEEDRLAKEAYALFDAPKKDEAEQLWDKVLPARAEAARRYGEATRVLESALDHDAERDDVRAELGRALHARILYAERTGAKDVMSELCARLPFYDRSGALRRALSAPAEITLAIDPGVAAAATVTASRYVPDKRGRLSLEALPGTVDIHGGPLQLEPGSYLIELRAPGRAIVLYPLFLQRGERVSLHLDPPPAASIPPGFVYVPAGRFLFGTIEESYRRTFFFTVPIHERTTEAFAIQAHQVTNGEWLAFVRALPGEERALRLPKAYPHLGVDTGIEIKPVQGGGYRLSLKVGNRLYEAAEGEPVRYQGRSLRIEQRWERMPVSGITADDAQSYATWLDRSGQVPGARLCTDVEWEVAGRGADGRVYPHGGALDPDDADYDETYHRDGMGPDEVGEHPASRSPFGVDDMSGNVYDWVRSSLTDEGWAIRGGSYYEDRRIVRLDNRNETTPSMRDPTVGVRLCTHAFREREGKTPL
ncbi:MAG: SUMF1/EgtB/PvdO family nonheme iron enzyme [Byssovorax sp.]